MVMSWRCSGYVYQLTRKIELFLVHTSCQRCYQADKAHVYKIDDSETNEAGDIDRRWSCYGIVNKRLKQVGSSPRIGELILARINTTWISMETLRVLLLK